MEQLINFLAPEVQAVLPLLLQDKATRHNIIWATDPPPALAGEATDKNEMTVAQLQQIGYDALLPRQCKQDDDQRRRTRKKGEVFTPAWVCNKMNDLLDADWFGRAGQFNTETEQGWQATTQPVCFEGGRRWQAYVDSRRLEITCGEAPFLVSRYDAATGRPIPAAERIGILDRKLRVVAENTCTEADWLKWAYRALQATYGYEYQGDSLLLARVNLLLTFAEAVQARLCRSPTTRELEKAANILAWNLWQMDGLKQCVPGGKRHQQHQQLDFFSLLAGESQPPVETSCRVRNWRSKTAVFFGNIQEGSTSMKFDYVIGNPPYQEDTDGAGRQARPIYNLFINEVRKMCPDAFCMITPSRWFSGGMGLDSFRTSMMNDDRIKRMVDYTNSKDCFPSISVSGGINYFIWKREYHGLCSFTNTTNGETNTRDRNLGEFPVMVRYNHAVDIIHKVNKATEERLSSITSGLMPFGLSTNYRGDKEKSIEKNLKLYASDGVSYISPNEIVKGKEYIKSYEVLISKTSAEHAGEPGKDGTFRVIPNSIRVIGPNEACTHSYFLIGCFENETSANCALRYMKTKFVRFLMLMSMSGFGLSKLVMNFVPLQDFTPNSDIDWSVPIPQIDQQLYRKYGLTAEEIDFIETHVKEMA